jgi:hypothetical protein
MIKLDSREFSQQAYQSLNVLTISLEQLAREVLAQEQEEKIKKNPAAPRGEITDQEIQKKTQSYCEKSSGLVQGLCTYISTWGLHRLSGDAKKFSLGTASDTQYKGRVYGLFLEHLKIFSQEDFVLWSNSQDSSDERSLVNLPLRRYTALNRLAIQLAKEWSFWAASVLGEAKEN